MPGNTTPFYPQIKISQIQIKKIKIKIKISQIQNKKSQIKIKIGQNVVFRTVAKCDQVS